MMEDSSGTLIKWLENIAKEFRVYFKKLLNRKSTTEGGEQEDTTYHRTEPEVLKSCLKEVQHAIQTKK